MRRIWGGNWWRRKVKWGWSMIDLWCWRRKIRGDLGIRIRELGCWRKKFRVFRIGLNLIWALQETIKIIKISTTSHLVTLNSWDHSKISFLISNNKFKTFKDKSKIWKRNFKIFKIVLIRLMSKMWRKHNR